MRMIVPALSFLSGEGFARRPEERAPRRPLWARRAERTRILGVTATCEGVTGSVRTTSVEGYRFGAGTLGASTRMFTSLPALLMPSCWPNTKKTKKPTSKAPMRTPRMPIAPEPLESAMISLLSTRSLLNEADTHEVPASPKGRTCLQCSTLWRGGVGRTRLRSALRGLGSGRLVDPINRPAF